MYRRIALITFFGIVAFGALSSLFAQEKPRKYALLVGINQYQHGQLDKLEFAEADAKDMAKLLKEKGEYEVVEVVGKDATKARITKELEKLAQQGNAGGIVLVGFAGHGMQPEDSDEAYFVPYDAKQKVVNRDGKEVNDWDHDSMVSLSKILAHLKASPAGAKALLVDACRNDPKAGRGRGFGSNLKLSDLPKNLAVLLSCSEGERSFEHSDWGHGAFFYHVMKGMNEHADKKKRVTALTLAAFVKEEVSDAVPIKLKGGAKQNPHPLINNDVDFGIAMNVTAAGVKPIPLTSTQATGSAGKLAEGLKYLQGRGVERDPKKALELIRESAEAGHGPGQYWLAEVYAHGYDAIKIDDKRAVALLRKAVEAGYSPAAARLGYCFLLGRGVPRDATEADRWLRRAATGIRPFADAGDAAALFWLGHLYSMGKGVERNPAEGTTCFRKAADLGDAGAQVVLGDRYANGLGTDKDDSQAVVLYRKAAEQGHAGAQYQLSQFLYPKGTGVSKDYTETMKWEQKAADQEFAPAINGVGKKYMYGYGVPKDPLQAAAWFQKAIDKGSVEGYANMGHLYQFHANPTDAAEATKWYRKAAELGDSHSRWVMGEHYLKGIGVPVDRDEAIKWFRLAAKEGNPTAKNELLKLGVDP